MLDLVQTWMIWIRKVSQKPEIPDFPSNQFHEKNFEVLSQVKLITCFHHSWIYNSTNYFHEIFFVLFFYKVEVFYWGKKCQYNCLLYQKKTLCIPLKNEPYNFVKKIRRFRIGEKHVMNSLINRHRLDNFNSATPSNNSSHRIYLWWWHFYFRTRDRKRK